MDPRCPPPLVPSADAESWNQQQQLLPPRLSASKVLTSPQPLRFPLGLLHCPVASHWLLCLHAGRDGSLQLHARVHGCPDCLDVGLPSSLHPRGGSRAPAQPLPRLDWKALLSSLHLSGTRGGEGRDAAHMLSARMLATEAPGESRAQREGEAGKRWEQYHAGSRGEEGMGWREGDPTAGSSGCCRGGREGGIYQARGCLGPNLPSPELRWKRRGDSCV